MWSWYWSEIDVVIIVNAATAGVFKAARQRWYQRERGGQLFADVSGPSGINLIATPPHAADTSGHTWLELNSKRCRIEISDANAEGLRLIGYWHTHPQRIPQISSKDIDSFRTFSRRHHDALPNPVAVIVGTSNTPEGIRAWSLHPNGRLEGVRKID